jgi:CubicO group peptidase (beta-lactamase class C family)
VKKRLQQRYYVSLGVVLLALAAAWWLVGGDSPRPSPPYPPSRDILAIQLDEPVLYSPRRAGDNWPITWADDGHLYTAWGDGQGFEPQIDRVSMGFARIEGRPPDLQGVIIRSPDEQIGSGRRGRKASGMLMIDGVLYMWARNADREGNGCQLAWSEDHAANWTWADWTFPEFGYCTFVNFGPNYAGARDEFVYMVTHDHPSAYTYADQFVLTRVPKESLADRTAYEYFVRFGGDDNPQWTRNITDRGAVFHANPGRAQRSSISYNADIGRYLWWQAGWPNPDGRDSRFHDGPLGIYDAPEPWGPWTTVFYTESFPGGPGETGAFPTKWMGEPKAGKQQVYMLSSRDDAFAVWPATLILGEGVWPTETWERATPEEMGMESRALRRAARIAGGAGHIIRGGRLVKSWGNTTRLTDLKSTTKSIGSLALALAVTDGLLQLDDRAADNHPDFGTPTEEGDPAWLDDITLWHLATHTSGFSKRGGYGPLLFEPGTDWNYSDGGTNWLAEIVTLAFGRDLNEVLEERIFAPIGITSADLSWRSNAYRPETIAGIPNREFGSGISANVDAISRIGYLMLRKGQWQDRQLLPASLVRQLSGARENYSLLWWNNADSALPNVPPDAFWAWGLHESLIIVIPSLDIVAARTGKGLQRGWSPDLAVIEPFLTEIARSVRSDASLNSWR